MPEPLISVIIPIFNTKEYLPACLDSIISQSIPELEIICIDDGSTDGSGDILRRYKKQDRRIKVLFQENLGASTAKNRGLALASGEFFVIVDSDDIFLPHALSKMLDAINLEGADIVHGGYITRKDDTGRISICKGEHKALSSSQALASLFDKSIHHDPWAKLFRRKLFTDNHLVWPESIRHATDVLVVHQAFYFAGQVQVIPDLVYERRANRLGSLTANYFANTFTTDRFKARMDLAAFIRTQGSWTRYKDGLRRSNEIFFEGMILLRMICYAKGANCKSIQDIVSEYNRYLPEFPLTEGEMVRAIFRILEKKKVKLSRYPTAEKNQITQYIEKYLIGLDLDDIGLTPEEQQLARTFSNIYHKRTNGFFFKLNRYCKFNFR